MRVEVTTKYVVCVSFKSFDAFALNEIFYILVFFVFFLISRIFRSFARTVSESHILSDLSSLALTRYRLSADHATSDIPFKTTQTTKNKSE